jgi:phasin family protein
MLHRSIEPKERLMADQTSNDTKTTTDAAAAPAAAAAKAATTVAKAATPARKPRAAKAVRRPRAASPAQRKGPGRPRKAATARAANNNTRIVNEGTRTMKKEANQAADRIQAVFGDVNERARTQIERSSRLTEELTQLSKGHVEAMVQSTKIAAKGLETVGQEVAEYSRNSFEDASAALKRFVEVKSPTDFFRLQGDFARTQFDSFVAESSKLSEKMIKLAGDVAEPLASRYSATAERVKAAVAV